MQRLHNVCYVAYRGFGASNNLYAILPLPHIQMPSLNQPHVPPTPLQSCALTLALASPGPILCPVATVACPAPVQAIRRMSFTVFFFFSFDHNDPEDQASLCRTTGQTIPSADVRLETLLHDPHPATSQPQTTAPPAVLSAITAPASRPPAAAPLANRPNHTSAALQSSAPPAHMAQLNVKRAAALAALPPPVPCLPWVEFVRGRNQSSSKHSTPVDSYSLFNLRISKLRHHKAAFSRQNDVNTLAWRIRTCLVLYKRTNVRYKRPSPSLQAINTFYTMTSSGYSLHPAAERWITSTLAGAHRPKMSRTDSSLGDHSVGRSRPRHREESSTGRRASKQATLHSTSDSDSVPPPSRRTTHTETDMRVKHRFYLTTERGDSDSPPFPLRIDHRWARAVQTQTPCPRWVPLLRPSQQRP